MTALSDPRWTSLSHARRDKLLEEYRDVNVDHDWWEHIYEMFTEDCADLGVHVDEMYFRGFWSQGDGACFDGFVLNWPLFLDHVGVKDQPLLLQMAASDGPWPGWNFRSKHNGHYYHENSCGFDFEMDDVNVIDEMTDPLRHAAFQVVIDGIVWEDLYQQFRSAFQDLMRKLYKNLEEEYDYQTDDEQVVDWMLENLSDEELADPDEEDEEEETWDGFVPAPVLDSHIEI